MSDLRLRDGRRTDSRALPGMRRSETAVWSVPKQKRYCRKISHCACCLWVYDIKLSLRQMALGMIREPQPAAAIWRLFFCDSRCFWLSVYLSSNDYSNIILFLVRKTHSGNRRFCHCVFTQALLSPFFFRFSPTIPVFVSALAKLLIFVYNV